MTLHFQPACLACGAHPAAPAAASCQDCGGAIGFSYDMERAAPDPAAGSGMWRYWRLLPVASARDAVTLGEGGTPLLESRLSRSVRLAWKDETRNPTGSHKDRALALALTQARSQGARVSVVVSAGSTGLSNAAYAARAGVRSVALIPAGAPPERLYPLSVYGARLIEVESGIDALIAAAMALSARPGIAVASTTRSANPVQAEAGKTIAHEIAEQAADAPPDWLLVPTGGGGTVAAIWRGCREAHALGRLPRLPRLAAIVPATHDALAAAWRSGITEAAALAALPYDDAVPTILTKLAHAHPPDGAEALDAIRESRGVVLAVKDADAAEGTRRIAAADGLYLEPSSGVLAPALDRLLAERVIPPGARVIGLACGSGFRETFALAERAPLRTERIRLGQLAAAVS